ncbi:MAG: hypothetical protein HRU30_09370 [Rhodobacteraceae bacterium]|nr:hypothetical protein [Paracoccaceae bacterium]
METDESAERIAQDLLEVSGDAILNDKYDCFRSCFSLPLTLQTVEGTRTVVTEQAFRDTFQTVRQHMADTGVIDLVRTIVSSVYEDENTIGSIHICSDIYKEGSLYREPYPVFSRIHLSGGKWRIGLCRYHIHDLPAHNAALIGTQSTLTKSSFS